MSRRNTVCSLVVGFAFLAAAATAAVVPWAPPPQDSPVAPAVAKDLWRLNEAMTKARAWQKIAELPDGGATPGMARYNVKFYDLDLDLAPSTQTLTGTVTMRAAVLVASLSEVEVHLADDLTVSGVTSSGVAVSFTHAGGVLTITLERDYTAGEIFETAVTYSGNPGGGSFGWSTVLGQPLIWTLSEPYGARDWWPCKDLNSDKADSVDIHVTVPTGLIVASNGNLISEETGPGTTTFHWEERYAICTYLVSLAAHPYVVFSDWYTPPVGDPLEIRNYVVPAYESDARDGYAAVPSMLQAFELGFGPYPFADEKYGHAHFPWGGGMEHQTCSSMSYSYYSQWFVAHELAHQWWGDMVTCSTFHHIWLNEGFATWSEAYWAEQNEGWEAYHTEMMDAAYYGEGTIYVENPYEFGDIFSYNLSYRKASWAVHMLRGVLGDEDFFAGLDVYRQQFGYGAASTQDLQAVMEQVSGKDLDAFIQQWIYGEYYPQYEYTWLPTFGDGETLVQFRLEQVQAQDVFVMPVRLKFMSTAGTFWETVENDRRVQYATFTVPGIVSQVAVDPDDWILKSTSFVSPTAIDDLPAAAADLVAYPNPFNPATTLRFAVPRAGHFRLDVFDATGRRIKNLVDGALPAGPHEVRWDGRDATGRTVAAGVYLAQLAGPDGRRSVRLTLVK